MKSRTRRVVITIATLACVQALAIVVYVVVTRKPAAPAEFRFEALSPRPAPAIEVDTPAGATQTIGASSDGVLIVHFWATWCEPCRKELPGLLARATALQGRVRLVAVAVDDTWPAIREFFGERDIPDPIVRARDSEGPRRWGADVLPDTYLVDQRGHVVERFLGARDWRSRAAASHLSRALERLQP